jgi:peptidyl-prolyl cis-trans isomerase A (cyclophilin A)
VDVEDAEKLLIIELESGEVVIELLHGIAPLHVQRVKTLARAGEYDNVAFHRVFEGSFAQTGDVRFGDLDDGYDPALVGRGGSELPDLPLEFAGIPFERGTVGMARAADLDSANSQFFITLEPIVFAGPYTVFGRVAEGLELVGQIEPGDPARNGAVPDPDRMVEVEVYADLFGLGLTEEEAREVAFLYEAALDRDGEIDALGLNFWIDSREAGLSIEATAQRFLDSDEFAASFGDPGGLSDRALVERLYLNVLDREGEAAGVEFWTRSLADPDFSRADLLVAFATSVENADTLAFVETLGEIEPGEWDFA